MKFKPSAADKRNDSKNKKLVYFAIAVFSFILLLIFSMSSSPLYTMYGYDSLEYKLAGAAVLDGLVMFRDIFHQKGALFLLLEAVGEAICRLFNNDRIGTFIIQLFNFFCSMFIASKCAYSFLQNRPNKMKGIKLDLSVLGIVCAVAFFWSGTILFGNQVEEFAVLYNFIVVYAVIKYVCLMEKGCYEFKPINGFIMGVCFAVTFWFKPTTAVFIAASVLFVGIYLIKEKQWSSIFKNLLTGVLGIAVVTLPLLLYYYCNHALDDLIYQCFAFNFSYMQSKKSESIGLVATVSIYGVIVGCFLISIIAAVLSKFKPICVYVSLASAMNLLMFLFSSVNSLYYLQVEVAVVFLILLSLFELRWNKARLISLCLVFALAATALFTCLQFVSRYERYNSVLKGEWQERITQTQTFIQNTEGMIDKSDNTDIICATAYYLDNRYFYYKTGLYPFDKNFCVEFFDEMEIDECKSEFYSRLDKTPPAYIVVQNERESINPAFDGAIQKAEEDYSVVYMDDAFTLYALNSSQQG